jgi:hypothetical protein
VEGDGNRSNPNEGRWKKKTKPTARPQPQRLPPPFSPLLKSLSCDSYSYSSIREDFIDFRSAWLALPKSHELVFHPFVLHDLLFPSLAFLVSSLSEATEGLERVGESQWLFLQLSAVEHRINVETLSKSKKKDISKDLGKLSFLFRKAYSSNRSNAPKIPFIVRPYSKCELWKDAPAIDSKNLIVRAPKDVFTWFLPHT